MLLFFVSRDDSDAVSKFSTACFLSGGVLDIEPVAWNLTEAYPVCYYIDSEITVEFLSQFVVYIADGSINYPFLYQNAKICTL